MEKLTLKQQEKIFKEKLLNHFEKQGYIYFHEYQNSYFRKFDKHLLKQFVIGGFTQSKSLALALGLSFLNIEDIIIEIGLPNYDLSSYQSRQNYFFTIRNNQINLTFNTEEHPVETEQDCLDYCQSIIYYMETDGKNFVEKYSYLPNILKEMDSLVKAGKYWNGMYGKGGILTGGFDSNFRGLIISKLCNDSNHTNKLDWIESRVIENEKWFPYFEKLKERLKSIEPIYNIQA
jgi:hypothetical protein